MQKTRTGAVIIDVFDWYRELLLTPVTIYLADSKKPLTTPRKNKKLLRKLDLSIPIFACLSCKYTPYILNEARADQTQSFARYA